MRLRIDLAYDGTDFKGWATQPGLRTVQEEVEIGLGTLLRTEPPRVTIAGRTDAGVHARGQVLHVDVADEVRPDKLRRRLHGFLAADIAVTRVQEVSTDFDARYSALWRRYSYTVTDSPEAYDPLDRHRVLSWPRPLDVEAMNQAAGLLLGRHDFAAFCKQRAGATTIRTLLDLTVERNERGLLVATVRADAFCHSMVRSLMGCLVSVGEGRRPVEWAREALIARARDAAIAVMPARALVLEEVAYPADADLAERGARTRARRTQDQVDPT